VRERPLDERRDRGTQGTGDPATDLRSTKRGGCRAEARTDRREPMGRRKPRRGRSVAKTLTVDWRCRSMPTRTKALKTTNGTRLRLLGNSECAQRLPHLGNGERPANGRNVRRVCRRRRAVGAARAEQTPEGRNPTSATCLEMAGRRREIEAAERLGKPASGTVAGGWDRRRNPGKTGAPVRAAGRGLPPPHAL